jgi:hypothetical protein
MDREPDIGGVAAVSIASATSLMRSPALVPTMPPPSRR